MCNDADITQKRTYSLNEVTLSITRTMTRAYRTLIRRMPILNLGHPPVTIRTLPFHQLMAAIRHRLDTTYVNCLRCNMWVRGPKIIHTDNDPLIGANRTPASMSNAINGSFPCVTT